ADVVEHEPGLAGRAADVERRRLRAAAFPRNEVLLVELGSGHQRFLAFFSWPAWYLKVRVGENSPSLWPTIDSVTYTGTCLRPSCTAIVCPTMSGMMVLRRDQVLMTFLSFAAFIASTFFSRWSSTNGPFFRLRDMITSDPCRYAGDE